MTFARLSVDEHYRDHEKFVMAVASVLATEAFELAAAGARHIQIDEPALLQAPDDLALARRALAPVVAEAEPAEVTLATYFGDAEALGPEIFDLPGDVVGLDSGRRAAQPRPDKAGSPWCEDPSRHHRRAKHQTGIGGRAARRDRLDRIFRRRLRPAAKPVRGARVPSPGESPG